MNRNLYIGNLPNNIDDLQLYNIFKEKYPSIHHVSIMTDKGESKGYGFIQFIDKYDYDKCLKEMDGYIIKGKPIKIRERKKKINEEKNNTYNYNKLNNLYNQNNNNNMYIYNNKKIEELDNDLFYKYNKINYKKEEEYEDLSSSNSSGSNSEKRKFSDNLDLIVNDDHNVLNKKIQESVDKMFEHYKYISKNSEVLNMIIYYSSNNCSFSDTFYF